MPSGFDVKPRSVWFGASVPGKTMMKVIESREGVMGRQSLTEIYKGQAHVALYAAALALHLLPSQGEAKTTRYSVVLADTRDFLCFRFRVKVPADADRGRIGDEQIIANATDGEWVSHAIRQLDDLCHQVGDDTRGMAEWLQSLRGTRELLRIAARRLHPGEAEEYAEYEAVFTPPPTQRPMP